MGNQALFHVIIKIDYIMKTVNVAIGQCCLYVWVLYWGLGILCAMGYNRWFEVA